jgi:hypothetical protein
MDYQIGDSVAKLPANIKASQTSRTSLQKNYLTIQADFTMAKHRFFINKG